MVTVVSQSASEQLGNQHLKVTALDKEVRTPVHFTMYRISHWKTVELKIVRTKGMGNASVRLTENTLAKFFNVVSLMFQNG